MLHHLKLALRGVRRRPGYALMNIAGMGVGLACCLLIGLYVYDEWSYDRHFEDSDRIVRLVLDRGSEEVITSTPSVMAPLFKRSFPEVREAVRLYNATMFGPVLVQREGASFQEERFFYGDSTYFDVFSHRFLAGTPATALTRPNTVVLTASMARKYFGDGDALGSVLVVNGSQTFEVTGVIEDVPQSSHLRFDFLASLVTRSSWSVLTDTEWNSANFLTYLKLSDAASAATLDEKARVMVAREFGEMLRNSGWQVAIRPQRLLDIHLRHEGASVYVYTFAAIALLVLLIACVNFTNLATARSTEHAKSVGVMKTLGAGRGGLVARFLTESVLASVIAMSIAVVVALMALPLFRQLAGKEFEAGILLQPAVVGGLLLVSVVVGLLAGAYPALVLSRFAPVSVLKGAFHSTTHGAVLRKGLVAFQFAIVVFLIAGTVTVHRQLSYVAGKNLGFDREHVVALPVRDRQTREIRPALQEELARLSGVRSVAAVSSLPGNMLSGYRLASEGMPTDQAPTVVGVMASAGFVETLGLQLLAGEGFRDDGGRTDFDFILNETAARRLGWTPGEAIGQRVDSHGRTGQVVGVVQDFHAASLHEAIGPLMFFSETSELGYIVAKLEPGNPAAVLSGIEQTLKRLAPDRPFDYRFLDASYDALYRSEQRVGKLGSVFSLLAIFVACLGLFGLASFSIQQRTKEIGVRKVLGASVRSIVLLLSREFALLVGIAFLVAAPAAYLVMSRWLEGFAFHAGLTWWIFALAGTAALGTALLTVGGHALRAALADPVDSLRSE